MAYEQIFKVKAKGNLDDIMTAIGAQLAKDGADTDEVVAALSFAAVDEMVMQHQGNPDMAQAHMTKLFNLMRAYMEVQFAAA